MDREQVIEKLRAHERQLKDAGIVRLSLFGSTARGEAGAGSDVDLLAAFDETPRISLLDIVGMELDLSEMLGCKVDLIEEGTLKPRVQQDVQAEVVRAFDPIQRFQDILDNISRIEEYTVGMDSRTFAEDSKTYDAVERCLARISEATVKLGLLA